MFRAAVLSGCVALVGVAPQAATAQSAAAATSQPDYFGGNQPKDKVAYYVPQARTTKQRVVVLSLFGAAAVSAGVGVLFHLDSRDKARELEAVGEHTRMTWTQELQDKYDSGQRSGTAAIISYSVSGAFLTAAFVAMYVTRPGEKRVIAEDGEKTKPVPMPVSIGIVPGGSMVTKQWTF